MPDMPITGTWVNDFFIHLRAAIDIQMIRLRNFFAVAFVAWIGVGLWRAWPAPLSALPLVVAGQVFSAVIFAPLVLLSFAALFTLIERATTQGVSGAYQVVIDPSGIHITREGLDTRIVWRSLRVLRKTGANILLQTDRWTPLPLVAFGSAEGLHRAFTACESLRGTSETYAVNPALPHSENPYAPPAEFLTPAGAIPARTRAVVARAMVPPEEHSWLRSVGKLARHRPQAVLTLGLAILLPVVLFQSFVVLLTGVVSFIVVGTLQTTNIRKAHAGLPQVIDFTNDGVQDWLALRQVQFTWRDTLLAAEDSDGFLIASRGGEFVFVPRGCFARADVAALTQLLADKLGSRAHLSI
jgi:hypothetical protein